MGSAATPSPAPDWRAFRAEFPVTARLAYLNTASGAPLPRRAADAAQRYYQDLLLEGDAAWPRWEAQRETARARVARLINASPGEVAFTSGASHAFTLIAALLGPPAHVVAMADEFPRVTIPFRRYGDEVTLVEAGASGVIPIERIAAAVGPRTRAVVTSAVMHGTGFRQDLAALAAVCRDRRVPLVVDATQAAGIVPIDVTRDGVDMLTFAGYKGTLGGHGAGAIYCRREMIDRPALERWRAARDPRARSTPAGDAGSPASVLELGILPLPAVFALGAGIELLEEVGVDRVAARVHELTDYLHMRLGQHGFDIASPRPRAQRAGITVVRAAAANNIARALAAAGIMVAARGEGVRVSLHAFNVEEEIDRLVDALVSIRSGVPLAPPEAPAGPLACIDLNGVLDAYEGWKGSDHWDPPAPGAGRFLRALRERGFRVVVFTTRHPRGVWAWLRRHGLDELVSDVTDVKPPADVFVDDHAVPFAGDFDETLRRIDGFRPHWARTWPAS